jgi:drug/metabolite transporter (DMT)-like permease
MRPSTSPIAVWAGLIVLYLVWGSTYLGIKVAVDTVPPFVMGFLRFVPAGILLAGAVAFVNRRHLRRPSRREAIDASLVGTCLLLGGMGLVAWAEQTIPSGVAALLVALMPMWLAIFGLAFFRERLPRAGALGIAVGLVGVAILAWPTAGVDDLDPAGLLALLISPVLWALGSIYAARRAVLPAPALFATGLEMVAGGVALLVASMLSGELAVFDPAAVSAESWAGLLYLLLVGSLVGYTTFAWLLTVAPLPRVATYAYVNPVVAVLLGAFLLQEPLTPRTIVASVVIVAAVVLIVTARGRVRPHIAAVTSAPVDAEAGAEAAAEPEPAAA